MSTFPFFFDSEGEKQNDNIDNNIDNSKEKRQLAVERGVKTEGMKTPVWGCICVCVFGCFSITAHWKLACPRGEACNMSVRGPSCRGCCVLLDGCGEQRRVLVVRGRQTEGGSLVCKVSLLTAGRNS